MKKYFPYILFFTVFFVLFKLMSKIPELDTHISNLEIFAIDILLVCAIYLKDRFTERKK